MRAPLTPPRGQSKLNLSGSPVRAMFRGGLIEENLFPFPFIRPDERETLSMVIESIDRFMEGKEELFRKFDKEGVQPDDYVQQLRELGLFGLIIPEEFGGIGLSNSAYSRVIQQTSSYDASTSLTIGAHSSIGMKGLLLFGTDAQKKKYLPGLAEGTTIAAFCLTEAGAGSDAASIKTRATKNPDGSWVLNGEKIWITNGGTAGFFTVFARTESERGRMSAFIVERGFSGVSTGPKEDKMGIRASVTTTVSFNNVTVPASNLLGVEGEGFKVAMAILNNGRTGLGGGCVGAMKKMIRCATKQASERKQFGKQIIHFDLVKEKIAQMTIDCFATESVVSMVGHYIDSGVEDFSVEAAVSKVFASEAMWRTADEALQIAGGNGFMREFPYERVVRDSRINRIFEGTNEILRLLIALSGAKEAGRWLNDIGKGIATSWKNPARGVSAVVRYAGAKAAQYTPWGGPQVSAAHPALRGAAENLARYIPQLALFTERILRRHGKDIVNEQLVSQRLANVAIDLFVGMCVIARVTAIIEEKGAEKCSDEIGIATIFAEQAARRMNHNIRRVYGNEDLGVKALANSIAASGGYRWDTL